MKTKQTPLERRRRTQAESSISLALQCSRRPGDVDDALKAAAYAVVEGKQKEKHVHGIHVKMREAFTRLLRRRGRR